MDISRCESSTSMKHCENYPSINVPGLCLKLKDKQAFYYDALSSIEPQLECPVKAGNYIANNATVDLSSIAFIPMSGSVWYATLKFFAGKKRELILCVLAEFKIVRARTKKRN